MQVSNSPLDSVRVQQQNKDTDNLYKSCSYFSSDSLYLCATYLYSLGYTRRLTQVDMKSTIFLILSLWRGIQHAQAAAVFAHFMVKALQPRYISLLTSSLPTPGI